MPFGCPECQGHEFLTEEVISAGGAFTSIDDGTIGTIAWYDTKVHWETQQTVRVMCALCDWSAELDAEKGESAPDVLSWWEEEDEDGVNAKAWM